MNTFGHGHCLHHYHWVWVSQPCITYTCAQVPEEELEGDLIKSLAEFYVSPGTSISANAWNEQRMAILHEAVQQRLLPAFALELRGRLLADARHAALHHVADKLWGYASRAPLQARIRTSHPAITRGSKRKRCLLLP